MGTRPFVIVAVVCAMGGWAGCSGSRKLAERPGLPETFPYHTAGQIQLHLSGGTDSLTAFEAKASLSVRTPARSGQFSAEMRARRGDSLYMSFSPGLGIEVARMLVTPDSFFVYDRLKKQLTYGSVAYAATILPVPLGGDDAFLALLDLGRPDPEVSWTVDADSQYYYLHDPSGLHRYTIDPALWRVVRYEERAADGGLIEERVYSAFDRFGGLYLPRRILLRRPVDDTTALLYYRDLTLNPSSLSFALRVKDSTERVLVDELHGFTNE